MKTSYKIRETIQILKALKLLEKTMAEQNESEVLCNPMENKLNKALINKYNAKLNYLNAVLEYKKSQT